MLGALVPCHDKDATPDILCGKTVRYALQTLGTEWGRNLIGQEIWLQAARKHIAWLQASGAPGITCDDVRFDNEAELIQELGGVVIELVRPDSVRMDHVSEAGVNSELVSWHIQAADCEGLLARLEEAMTRS